MEENAAILIDCWDEGNTHLTSFIFYNWIKYFIKYNKSIKTIILSSYDCNYLEYKQDCEWYNNTKNILGEKLYAKKTNDIFNFKSDNFTSRKIINWKIKRNKFSIHHEWEFKKVLEKVRIDNIYFCGRSFESCVANRPVGYKSIRQNFPNIGIRVNLWCIANYDWNSVYSRNIHLDENWKKIGLKTYELEKVKS